MVDIVVRALAAGAAVVVTAGFAFGSGALPGIPAQYQGYRSWTKINAKPIRGGSPAHSAIKTIYTSKRKAGARFPNGTIIVKEGRDANRGFVSLIAVMRKVKGADPAHGDWRYVEYTRSSASERFAEIARDGVCWGCHVGAKKTDWVFTQK